MVESHNPAEPAGHILERLTQKGEAYYGAVIVIGSIKTKCWSMDRSEIQEMMEAYAA